MDTILIVDDEINYPLILSAVLQEEGYETLTANSGQEALDILTQSDVDLVLTDMKMPKMDGMTLLERVKEVDPALPVIMMTAFGTVEKAVAAMHKGAYSYLLKPFDNQQLVLYVNKAIDMRRVVKENRLLRNAVETRYSFGNLVAKSKAMLDIFDTIGKVAPTTATVLVEGPSGTGKELVAKSIHYNSPRRNKPFIPVNCSALAESLLESELFGHEKGAFTGAVSMKKGRFELADGGTLFLDEIGEISPALQVKLLRVLQERVFERVGGEKPISVNFRLIAATNKSLKEEMHAGRFREDLFYRLNVMPIILPALKDRLEDIRPLVAHFIQKFQNEHPGEKPVTHTDKEVERLFFAYSWPGNVRELENVIERAMVMCPGQVITVDDLPKNFKKNVGNADTLRLDDLPLGQGLYKTLAHVEKQMILQALRRSDNVQAHAAALLGIGKSGLNQKLKKYGIDISDLDPGEA